MGTATTQNFVDYYEVLEVSANASPDTIHRVYRILAQRLHPDNPETGNETSFRMLTEAYRVLSEPEHRAKYDVMHTHNKKLRWEIYGKDATQGLDVEKKKRSGVLAALYKARVANPQNGSMNLNELEDLLGCPKEHLEFTLWYLKELQQVQRADNGRYMITAKGVDAAEQWQMPNIEPMRPLLNAPLRTL